MYEWLDAGLDALSVSPIGASIGPIRHARARPRGNEPDGQEGRELRQVWTFGTEGPACSFLFDLDPGLPSYRG